MDYQRAYALLVGVMSNAIDEIAKSPVYSREIERAIYMLQWGLLEAEEMYICLQEQK